jgi:peptidoglycan LD-endopeptidase LytH
VKRARSEGVRLGAAFLIGVATGALIIPGLWGWGPRLWDLAVRSPPSGDAGREAAGGVAADERRPRPAERPLADEPAGVPPIRTTAQVEVGPEPGRRVAARPQPLAPVGPADIVIPVAGVTRAELRDHFDDARGGTAHRAIDIAAVRGTPVLAAVDGEVLKLFLSRAGGITLYQLDDSRTLVYYYAHLDGYAEGIVEKKRLRRGEVLGYVGTTGNAPPGAPHLHFAIERLANPREWWRGDPINPYPILMSRGVTYTVPSAPAR